MDERFNAILSISLIPQIVWLIIKNEGVDENTGLDMFYKSETYEQLAREETKVWHYSPLMIYCVWKKEKETGEVIFPEEL